MLDLLIAHEKSLTRASLDSKERTDEAYAEVQSRLGSLAAVQVAYEDDRPSCSLNFALVPDGQPVVAIGCK